MPWWSCMCLFLSMPQHYWWQWKRCMLNEGLVMVSLYAFGPLQVGGIKPGCFKIGNTGGMLDNILASKLYRPGSVAYVSRSGGMSNELNNIISRTTDGVFEGVAIGGDRWGWCCFSPRGSCCFQSAMLQAQVMLHQTVNAQICNVAAIEILIGLDQSLTFWENLITVNNVIRKSLKYLQVAPSEVLCTTSPRVKNVWLYTGFIAGNS